MGTTTKQIYQGSFKDRPRFDDGGYVDYASVNPNDTYLQQNDSGGVTDSSGQAPTLSTGISASALNNSFSAPEVSAGKTPQLPATQGALGSILSKLGLGGGDTSNTAALGAAVKLLSAYGNYKQNAAGAKLPSMPALGALPALPGSSSTGYGPAGGYGFQNYATAPTAPPGLGFAPRTQSKAAPSKSFFTYGTGPEQQYFQQVTPGGGPIAPVTMATGGAVPRFDMGGMMSQPGQTPMTPRPPMGPMQPPAPQPQPMMPPAQQGMQRPPAPPSTMMQRMQAARPAPGARPFATGGTAPPNEAANGMGALSQVGESRHVTGPGDGTSDSIPARLANGEYVIDAQAVSMLGNGDNGAGAKRLDEFRKNLRAHKGAALSKGRMAPNAKPIHKYMGGQ